MVLFSANYVRKAIKPRLLGNRHHKRKRETTQREPNSPPATLHRLLRRKKEEEQGERKKSDLIMIGIHEGPSTAGRYVGSILDKVESSKSQNRNSNTNITAANSPDPEDPSSPQTYLIVVTVLSTLLPLLCIILSIALGRRLWVKYRSEGYSGVVEREDTAQTSLRSREGGSRKSSRASRVTKETNSRDQLIPQDQLEETIDEEPWTISLKPDEHTRRMSVIQRVSPLPPRRGDSCPIPHCTGEDEDDEEPLDEEVWPINLNPEEHTRRMSMIQRVSPLPPRRVDSCPVPHCIGDQEDEPLDEEVWPIILNPEEHTRRMSMIQRVSPLPPRRVDSCPVPHCIGDQENAIGEEPWTISLKPSESTRRMSMIQRVSPLPPRRGDTCPVPHCIGDSTVASPLEDHQQLATVEVITTDVSAEEEAAAAAAAGGASTPTPSTSTAPKPTTSLMQKSLGKQQLPLTQQLSHPETSSHHHHPQFLDATHPHNHRYLHLNNPHFRYSQRRTRSISAHDRSNGVLSKVSVSMRNHSLVVEVEDPPRRRSVSDISEGGKTKLMRTEAEVEPLSKHFLSKKKKDELIVKVDKSLELGVEGLSQADVIRSASPSPYPLSREGSPRPRGPSQDEGVIDLALRTVQVEPVETYPYEVVEHQDQEIQTVSLGNGNFGLSTSDLSLDSSGNTTYTYGNQVPYGGGYYGYPVTQGYPMDTRSRRLHVVVPLGHHSDEDPAEYRRGRVDRKASLPSSALEEYRPSRYARAQLGKQYSLPVMPIIRPARFTPMETNVSYREEDDSQETIEE
ncbi:uncharacterized protein LOC143025406 isoform X2 [Oratosquilla oratoria]|uniref:uncharacterized protein LOC143025406 isoform X2 n=1 Tax=Oratosquilla oratoria TaxID=337810 RepID=UPI003F75C4F1